jgi:hypothetical protein
VIDFQPDHRSFQDRQHSVVLFPGAAVGQPWVQPVAGRGDGGSVAGGFGARRDVGVRPGRGVGEGEHERQAGHVVPGIEHDQDVRVALPPVPGRAKPLDHLADLCGGDRGLVVTGAEA